MYHLVYTSHAVKPFTEEELLELLRESRSYNKSKAITGMLLYLQGKFIQVLEGEEKEVRGLYSLITADPRHKRVALISEGHSPDRLFKEWSMGFKRLTYNEAEALGFRDIDQFFSDKDVKKDTTLLMTFLKLFYKKNMVDYAEA